MRACPLPKFKLPCESASCSLGLLRCILCSESETVKRRGLGRCASRFSVVSGVRFAHPSGSCSPGPGGAWEAGEGLGFLSAYSAGRARGPHAWSRGSCRSYPGDAARGARAAAVLSRLWSAGPGHGRIPERVSGPAEAERRAARAARPASFRGLSPTAAPPRPPLCFVSAGPRRCDSHFRSGRLEGAGRGGAGEAVREGAGDGGGGPGLGR
jgi:hypothetical protein